LTARRAGGTLGPLMSDPRRFRIGLVQMRCGPDPAANLATATLRVREAAARGARVVCLPELFRTPYFCQREDHASFDLAEPVPGPTTDALGAVARDLQIVILAPVFERRAAGVYHNSVAVLDADGSIAGLYRKMHIPDDPLFYEKFYFTPGDLGFQAIPTRVGRIGTLICWDQWYPEAARLTALAGADVLVYPTAIGWHPQEKAESGEAQVSAWQTMQRAHAIANGVYVAAVNRVGHEGPPDGGLEFWGGSFVCDPFGVVIAEASRDAEEVLVAECSLGHAEDVRRCWPFLRDRRIDAYAPITKRFLLG
jgi:N-carbamoylputrescine amidase